MAITPLPPAPEPTDSTAQFNSKAFAWVGSLDQFTTETNALAVAADADATTAVNAKNDAESARDGAIAAANVTKWVSGTTYAEGAVVWSPVTFVNYRRKIAGGGTTDPSSDLTNWEQVTGTGNVSLTGTQTLTNKTINGDNNTITNVDLAGDVKGTLPLANGGTGLTSAGTAGNILVSNGTAWASQPQEKANTFQAVATGSLIDGSMVALNSDGTVSVVNEFQTNTMPLISNPAVLLSKGVNGGMVSAFDSENKKVVIAFRDASNSNYGTAVVGTLSGTTITFGSQVVFRSAATTPSDIAYDTTNQKIVIVYVTDTTTAAIAASISGTTLTFGTAADYETVVCADNKVECDQRTKAFFIAYRKSAVGTAKLANLSGTTLSFTVAVTFNASGTTSVRGVTYDVGADKMVITFGIYQAERAIVGEVSFFGNAILGFGSPVTYHTISGYGEYATSFYDTENNKTIILCNNFAIIGTVSGTAISFGSKYTFDAQIPTSSAGCMNTLTNNIVIAYSDSGNSSHGTVIVGTISSGVISFSTAIVFEQANSGQIQIFYDSAQDKTAIIYADNGNSSYMTYVVGDSKDTNSNKYIGVSSASYSNGQTAIIESMAFIDDAQTGLTPAEKYYVTRTGGLSTTAGNPSVFAGTAISATKLLIKG